ncbi:MAG: hypothetical protein KF865_03030 [Bdellovibrionaceae bacterium]|nr:hypothetical protein [Pseudobdellovibrionaceae bacterium]
MHNSRKILFQLLQLLPFLMLGCSSQTIQTDQRTPTAAAYGNSSGGGGFVEENSALILQQAARGLARMIRFSSPALYTGLPSGWNQEKMAQVIEDVRSLPNRERRREGRALMLDYGKDKKGPFIAVLKPFFLAYSSVPIKYADNATLMKVLRDVRLKLLHETAHHFQMNENQAEEFGIKLLSALENDLLFCYAQNVGTWPTLWTGEDNNSWEPIPDHLKGRYLTGWIIHRPTGFSEYSNAWSPQAWRFRALPANEQNIDEQNRSWLLMMEHSFKKGGASARLLDFIHTKDVEKDLAEFQSRRWRTGLGEVNAERHYEWLPTPPKNGRQVFQSLDPIAASEFLEIHQSHQKIIPGRFYFRLEKNSEEQSFSVECLSSP